MSFFSKIEHRFQPVPDDKQILVEPFLKACNDGIIPFLESLGTTFIPVKTDVAGNVNKLSKKFESNREKYTTINAMLEDEVTTQDVDLARTGGLWLKRGLEFHCALLRALVEDHKTGNDSDNLGVLARGAYDQTLRKFHGWFAQKLILAVTRTLPTKKSFLKLLVESEEAIDDQLFMDMYKFERELFANVEVLNELFVTMDLDDQSKV